MDVIGGKWKIAILWHLHANQRPLRFTALRRELPALSPRMLARQLRELEAQGVIYRDVFPVVPPRVEYGLTARGKTLTPILDAMCLWGKRNGWRA